MNCYRCLVEIGSDHQPAFAMCQRCGAGVCATHLVELTVTPMVGMAGGGQPRRSMICRHCHQVAFPVPQKSAKKQDHASTSNYREPKTPILWKMWRRVRGQREVELLNSEEVLAEAELHLKRQRNL